MTRIPSALMPPQLFTLRGTLIAMGLFGLANALIRRLAGNSLSMDDAKTNLFTQVWQWGYQPDNPPLFEWLVILLHPLTGGGLWSFLIIKYVALAAAGGFVHLTVRAYTDNRVAFGTALGMVLLYQIGWNFHQAFTHSALLLPGVAAAIWAGLKAVRHPGAQSAVLLGGVAGIAVLTKYNAAFFLLAFAGAAMSVPEARRALFRPVFLVSLSVALLIVLPHGIWFLNQSDAYRQSLEVTMGREGAFIGRVGSGLWTLVISILTFFLPWGVVAGPALRHKPRSLVLEERLLWRTAFMGVAGLLLAVLALGIANISERYLIPVLLPAYIAGTSLILRERRIGRLWWMAVTGMAVAVTLFRLVTYAFPGAPFCEDCREFVPYTALEAPIRQTVPEGAVLLVREENTGGNLVTLFPNSPVRVFTSLHLTNPVEGEGRPCWLIWSEDMVGGVPLEDIFASVKTDPRTVMVSAPWTHPFKSDAWRTTIWGISPITDKNLYATFCTSAR